MTGLVIWGGGVAWAQTPATPTRPEMPELRGRGGERGEEAIRVLAGQLPEVAAHYHKSADELRGMLRRDKSLRLDAQRRLVYSCEGLVAPVAGGDTNGGVTPQALFALPETFFLHSRANSTKKIFLDFDGHTLSANVWTASYNGGTNIIAPAWDTDGNPGSFSSAEQTAIQQIWFRVAEDFAGFDVDVTTEFPGEAALTRSSLGDSAYGVRALISPISSYVGSYGGIAYVGVFDSTGDYNKPALVFPERLGNSEKNIAEATTHEVGHTLGLSHDGTDVGAAEYYTGQGNWAPIMGVAYSKPISQWSRGEYNDANNPENDLVVITQNGLAYRTDDFGGSTGAAAALAGLVNTNTGILERTNDVDYFSVNTGGGAATFTVRPWERGANVHLRLAIYNSAGTLLTNREVADTADGTIGGVQPVSIAITLAVGTNFVSVEGLGSGNPVTTGYSDYGSLGNYALSWTLPVAPVWLPTAGGNYSWTNGANWGSGAAPNAADLTVTVANNIAGNQTVTLDTTITLARLWLGDANATHGFTIERGAAGQFVFDMATTPAGIFKTGGTNDFISPNLGLLDDLTLSNSTAAANLTLAGNISGNRAVTKTGAGRVTLSGTNSYTGNTLVSAGTLALGAAASFTSSSMVFDVRSNAVWNTSGFTGIFPVKSGQRFIGGGRVAGDISFVSGSTLSPGAPNVGDTLTFSNNLTLASGSLTRMEVTALTNDGLRVHGTLTYGGSLTVVNLGNPFVLGNSYQLFSATNYAGAFTATNLPALNPGLAWRFEPAAGTLQVVVPVATNPTNISALATTTGLQLNWPASHIGWRLQAQTNFLSAGLGTNWFEVSGGNLTNALLWPWNRAAGGVYFRLVYP